MIRTRALLAALLLSACQQAASTPSLPRGDEILPGDVQVAGLLHCDAARLELAAVVLNGPPKASALEDVVDARAPGCTWVASDGGARVRLNVYDARIFAALKVAGPTQAFDLRARLHAGAGQGEAVENLGARAARFGFAAAAPTDGVLLVETPTRTLEIEGHGVPAPKLLIFARGVTETIEQAP